LGNRQQDNVFGKILDAESQYRTQIEKRRFDNWELATPSGVISMTDLDEITLVTGPTRCPI